ncbi:MAG TPA: hypothetical protein PLG33_06665 [Prolixibacteraceae bacterium]|nr:hypothetical protein [Prolixibacteraceae bacterium]HPR85713.1 hypothetical protein [Prolixibacteraceae bacterium]
MTRKKIKKKINLKKESIEVIDESIEDFEKIFGRKPTSYDPVFLDQIFYNASELHQSMINELSENLNLKPSHIYAFDKLGYLVSDSNYNEWTNEEIKDWRDAVEEGEKIKNGEIKIEQSEIEKNVIAISNNIPQLVCLFSLLNWKIRHENKGVNLYGIVRSKSDI